MLPEESELLRLEAEQTALEDQVTGAELALETVKSEALRFQHRYYQTVGRLYAELDYLDARIARELAEQAPRDEDAQVKADAAQEQARKSAEEAGLVKSQSMPPVITAELKYAYRQAAKLMHPDRATTDSERLRRNVLMAQVNQAYELGDQATIEKMIVEFGQDPEAITGEDVPARIVKAIRRIAQLRRRLDEVQHELGAQHHTELIQLKQTVEEAEAMGGNPLEVLAQQLLRELSEKTIRLEAIQH